ncbi:MAG: ATP-binding protein [Proteobacteria bacterium]|nr:ATP-binding protein [Pseudomonadota bacterium]
MRKLTNDFILKFSLICTLAFIIAFIVTYIYLKRAVINNQNLEFISHASKIINDIVSDGERFKNYVLKLKEKEVFHLISSDDKLYNASFVTLLDVNGKVISRYSGVVGDSLGEEDFFKESKKGKKTTGFFHQLAYSYLEREVLLPNIIGKKALAYSVIFPYRTKANTIYVWYCNILNDKSSYLKDIIFAHIDGAVFWDVNENIISWYFDNYLKGFDKDKVKIKKISNKIYLEIEGKKILDYEEKIFDFNKRHIASLFLIKDRKSVFKTLYVYTGIILFIFVFSSLMGIAFVVLYFKKFSKFVNDLLSVFNSFSQNNYDPKNISHFNKIIEFDKINKSLKELSLSLQNQQEIINEKISYYINEYINLYEAIHELNSKQNFVDLVESAVDFIKQNFKFNVVNIENINLIGSEEVEKYKKISYYYDGKEYGFYVEVKEENLVKFPVKFWDLFIEIFKTNFERIANFREVQKSYTEANYFSQVLLKLLQKHTTNEIFMYLLERAKEFCNSDSAFIGLYDKSKKVIRLQFFLGIQTEAFKTLSFPEDKGLGGYVLKEGKTVFIENYFEDPRIDSPFKDIVRKEGIVSVIATPIIHSNEIYGVLYVAYKKLKKEVTREVNFIEKLAYVAALSLEKESLIMLSRNKEEELRKAYDEIISKRKEINALLKNYKDTNIELERINRELNEQYEIVKKSYEELERLNRAKDIFLGILSHELRSPLSILKGYIDTLLSENFMLSEEIKEILLSAKKSVNNLWQIVEDLLDYSRIELGQMTITRKQINAKNLIDTVKEEIDNYLKERKQELLIDVDPEFSINVDERWMRRALANLLTNSVKFTPDGKKIFLSMKKVKKEEMQIPNYVIEKPIDSAEYIAISVKDEGVGINLQEINRIFEKFYEIGDIKSHSSGKYRFMTKGLGLGLTFVKQIVNLHGGVVFAESAGYDPEKCPGSTFYIFIPLQEGKKSEGLNEVKKKTILIIENEHEVASFLEMVFSPHYNVVIVPDGGAGYLKTLELRPMVVFINILLPGYSGYEVCSMIKEDKRIQDIPVILYSSGLESFDEVRAERAKANMFFSPLFDVDNLIRVVNYYSNKENN